MTQRYTGWLLGLLCLTSLGQANEVLRIGVPNAAYPPYVLVDEQNVVNGGILYDLLAQGLADFNMQPELVLLPNQRANQMMALGKLDGHMYSPSWSENAHQYLWLDTGLVLEDVLLYRSDLPFVPKTLNSLKDAEVVTHIGYVYPTLEPYFRNSNTHRLDKYSEAEMLQSLIQAPTDSTRLAVMERRVWEWYQPLVKTEKGLELRVSPTIVDCIKLHIQILDTPKMRALLPKLQARIMMQKKEQNTCSG